MPFLPTPAAAEASLWAIILFPLAGALINGLVGRRIGKGNTTLVAIGAMVGSLALAAIAFSWVLTTRNLRYQGAPWIAVTGADGQALVNVAWGLLVDRLSGTMLLVVTGVGTLIHIYSVAYMSHEDDAGYARFFAYLNLFVAAMLMLVLGDSLRPHLRRLGGRRAVPLPADRLLVHRDAERLRRQEGVHHQPHRRLRLPGRRCSSLLPRHRDASPSREITVDGAASPPRLAGWATSRVAFCGAAAVRRRRAASRRRSRCTSGCPTPWPARRRSRP